MPCPKDGTSEPLVSGVLVKDWSGLHPYEPDGGIHFPSRLEDLVVVVQKIEDKGRKAKAVGSVYSLSKAPDSDDFVIYTKELNRHLSQPFPASPTPLGVMRVLVGEDPGATGETFRSSEHNKALLKTLADDDLPAKGKFLVHVEAGIKIRQLLADLAGIGLALPTMGAGGGQSLAGALATGTHGGDIHLGVLGDAVRAVHLVGPGGQEIWVEGNGGAGRSVGYSEWPGWCHDTRVVRDSDFLRSVVVGVGRFGIIYSMVLEVESQYRLAEQTEDTTWSKTRAVLLTSIASGYTEFGGIFAATAGPCGQLAAKLQQMKKGTYKVFDPGTRQWNEVSVTPADIAAKQKELDECLKKAKKTPPQPLKFGQIVIDTASGSRTWITRRWLTTFDEDELNTGPDLLGYFCTHDAATITLVVSATAGVALTLGNIASGLSAIPIAGGFVAADYLELAAQLEIAAASFTTLGGFAATVIDLLREFDGLGSGLMKDLITEIAGAILSSQLSASRCGPSGKIMDTHNYQLDSCFSVNSAEFFFNAEATQYIGFVDAVRKAALDLGPLLGTIALRFVARTTAKLGMQRFKRTVCIEVGVSRPGSANAEFMNEAHKLAAKFGGIPHWGQEHQLDEARVEAIYGTDLEIWRWALAETEAQKGGTFSSAFTRVRGLETRDALAVYRAHRYVAAITSG